MRNLFKRISNSQKRKECWKVIGICIVFFIAVFIFFHKVILLGFVSGFCMTPTLFHGDFVAANGLAYVNSQPQRGDIIVFQGEKDSKKETLIKRVIGLPGDDVMFIDGKVYICGQLYQEEYLDENTVTDSSYDYEVPEGCFFVMGDNREHSYDSRFWEEPYVRMEDIKGKVIFHK